MNRKTVIFFLGPPGSGKGTLCKKLASEYDFIHIPVGELLRNEQDDPDSQYSKLLKTYLQEGKIVPADITLQIMQKCFDLHKGRQKFLIDGFPRNKDNLQAWEKKFEGSFRTSLVIYLNCPGSLCMTRCLERGGTTNRSDDVPEILKRRIDIFERDSVEVLRYFKRKRIMETLDATRDTDIVYQDIITIFKKSNLM